MKPRLFDTQHFKLSCSGVIWQFSIFGSLFGGPSCKGAALNSGPKKGPYFRELPIYCTLVRAFIVVPAVG